MDEWQLERHDLNQVILLDALGNAALDTSWHHIMSYINSSNSIWVRKTGVHSLRKFKHEKASKTKLDVIYTIKSPECVSVTLLREPSSGHVSYFELGKAY
jgi:hypothetical protein